jgi:hypothetical protein
VLDDDIDVGEGETQRGTVAFPKDPQSKIEVLWKDPETKTQPSRVQIDGDSSRWKTLHNISLGITLKELEKLNAKPFHLAGFDWDYSGTVMSWDGGSLAKDIGEVGSSRGRVVVRLNYSPQTNVSESEMSQVMGDRDFPSSQPIMQKLNPKVYQIIWVFP